MFCSVCGASVSDDAKFCTSCGAPIVPTLGELQPDPAPAKAAPILDMPEPTAPMYTPVGEVPAEPPAVYSEPAPAYADYSQDAYTPLPAVPQSVIDSIFTWGLLGTIFAFNITILGIIFSAIARKKSTECLNLYGYLPGKAKAGRILSTVGLIGGIVMTVFVALIIVLYAVIIFAAFSSGAFN